MNVLYTDNILNMLRVATDNILDMLSVASEESCALSSYINELLMDWP